jgi:hypothetical protein
MSFKFLQTAVVSCRMRQPKHKEIASAQQKSPLFRLLAKSASF